MSHQILFIGSITHSTPLYSDGIRDRFGGGVMYGAKAAIQLGAKTSVITIGAPDIEPGMAQLEKIGISVDRIARPTSNNFANDYTGPQRTLKMSSYISKAMRKDELNRFDLTADGVILNPLYHEITADLLSLFQKKTKKMLDVQGLTRKVGQGTARDHYPVSHIEWKTIVDFVGRVDILKLSDEDMTHISFPNRILSVEEKLNYLTTHGYPLLILTQ